MTVSAFALGALAFPVFGLGFADTILTILFINLLSLLPPALWSSMGPRFGLRQMVLSRYYFGFYAIRISTFSISIQSSLLTLMCSRSDEYLVQYWMVIRELYCWSSTLQRC